MADSPADGLEPAADALLDLAVAKAGAIITRARQGADSPEYIELVKMEVAGSMALHMILHRYMQRTWQATRNLGQDDLNKHLLRSAVTPLVGAIMAYVDDMPDLIRSAYLSAFSDTLSEALKLRRQQEVKLAAQAKRAWNDRP